MKKNTTNLLLLFLALSAGFLSCTPKYTAHFTNDPFYKGENLTAAQQEKAVINEVQPIVTPDEEVSAAESATDQSAVASKNNVIARLGEIPSIKKLVTEHKENVKELEASNLDQKTLAKEIRKEEKRAHKEVKKQLVKEIKEVKKAKDSEAMNRKVYIGIIIAAAGIVIAILASGGVGAVAIIVGVGLIAWGLIEQGGV
jgi:23S rRNA A1618 N6-methylase RlmF